MSASRLPIVTERNGQYAISIAPGTVLRWCFKLHAGRLHCVVKVDLRDVLKRYEVNVDTERDQISFPVLH
jgi:hypothetical protein